MTTLAAFSFPFRADRDAVRERMAAGDFIEVFIDTPLATCEQRNPKACISERVGANQKLHGCRFPMIHPKRQNCTS